MSELVSIFLPTRKGSIRVKQKNTRPFSVYKEGGLLELKLEQLIKVKKVHEIILSTNDEKSKKIAEKYVNRSKKLKIINRPNSLASDNTKLSDLIKYAGNISDGNHLLWTHVTSPFIDALNYEEAIKKYFCAIQEGYDSLMTVKKIQTYLWDKSKNDIINRITSEKWPKTQDLKPYFEIDSGIFIASKDVYIKENDRIGEKPYLLELDEIKSFDIDWDTDFKLAEFIFDKFLSS